MQCPMDSSGHESGKQPHNERHLNTVNKNIAENAGIFLPIKIGKWFSHVFCNLTNPVLKILK